eukprot:g6704.t1
MVLKLNERPRAWKNMSSRSSWSECRVDGSRKVLRRIHPNSLAEQWNKRFNRRLTPGLLLLSVNGEEDHEEIMQILKDEAKLSLRFAPEEVMRRFGATQGSAKGFQVETWAAQFLKGLKLFQLWNRDWLQKGLGLPTRSEGFGDGGIDVDCGPDPPGLLLVVHPGDRILSVNGESDNVQAMVKALQSQTRQKNSILLEPGDRDAYMGGYPAGAERAEDAEAQFEVALEDSLGPFGFQVEHQRVKGIDEGSPLAMWNLVCRSRGEEDLCVELGDTLLQEASSSGRRIFQLRRSKERQASVRALGARPDAASGTAAARGAGAEGPRVEMVRAAEECVAALDKPLRELFETKPRPKVVSLADCVRDLGAIEALEESFEAIYKCQHCTPSRTFASKRAWLWGSLPPVLPVQLKRFRRERDGAFRKSQTRIQTSSTLDLSDLLLSSKEQQLLKSLVKKEHEALNAEVLLNSTWQPKLCDFGLAKIREQTALQTTLRGVSPIWAPPEMFDDKGGVTEKADVYSFGIILFELGARKLPYSDVGQMQLPRVKAKGQLPRFPAEMDPDQTELIRLCLAPRPSNRPAISALILKIKDLCKSKGIDLEAEQVAMEQQGLHFTGVAGSTPHVEQLRRAEAEKRRAEQELARLRRNRGVPAAG